MGNTSELLKEFINEPFGYLYMHKQSKYNKRQKERKCYYKAVELLKSFNYGNTLIL